MKETNQNTVFVQHYKPKQFFILVFLGTWIPFLLCAYYGYYYPNYTQTLTLIGMLVGLCVPFFVTMYMIYRVHNKYLLNDFYNRLNFRRIRITYLSFVLLMMPIVLLIATAISLLFGGSIDQFKMSREYMILSGTHIISIILLCVVPILEELGWRGYGVDSIKEYFNVFNTSCIFAFLWALWHVPLFFMPGTYHYGLVHSYSHSWYVVNFFLSVIPATIILNWLYYKNNRSITIAVLMHFMFNFCAVVLQTGQLTKCIMTIVLLLVSGIIIVVDKKLFFRDTFFIEDTD